MPYNEPYLTAPLTARRAGGDGAHERTDELTRAGRAHCIAVSAEPTRLRPAADNVEHLFKEHR